MSLLLHQSVRRTTRTGAPTATDTSAEVAKFGRGEVQKMQDFEIENVRLLKKFIKGPQGATIG